MGLLEAFGDLYADYKIKKLIRKAPHHTLANYPEGSFACVIGKVAMYRGKVLTAPLSGRRCAYYSIVVRGHERDEPTIWGARRTEDPVITLAEDSDGLPFELVVDGERAVIDPRNAWISSGFDRTVRSLHDPDAAQVVARLGVVKPDVIVQEAVLAVDEQIAVYGAGVRELDPTAASGEAGYRDTMPLRLRFTGSAKFPLVIRDDVKQL
jgi:hypothetical protein